MNSIYIVFYSGTSLHKKNAISFCIILQIEQNNQKRFNHKMLEMSTSFFVILEISADPCLQIHLSTQ